MGRVKKGGIDPAEFAEDARELSETISSMDGTVAERRQRIDQTQQVMAVPISKLSPRTLRDLRVPSLPFVVGELAPSILACGQIETIAVDQNFALIAGGNRRFAFQLCAVEPKNRVEWLVRKLEAGEVSCPSKQIDHWINLAQLLEHREMDVLVRVFQITDDVDLRIAIEIAENDVRRDFSYDEVIGVKEALERRGYSFGGKGGRSMSGTVSGMTLMSTALRKSQRHLRRIINQGQAAKPEVSREERLLKVLKIFLREEQNERLRHWAEDGISLLKGEEPIRDGLDL